MATQLQRALGLASGKQEIPKGSEPKAPKRERSDKKATKADPYPNLPRRPFGINKEA